MIPQQLRTITDWEPGFDTTTATPAPAEACVNGTWKPDNDDLADLEMVSVACDVEIGSWRFDGPIATTIVANGSIVVRGSNVTMDTADRPSLIATGTDAAVEIRASNTTTGPIAAEGPVSLHSSNIEFTNPSVTSITSTGPAANIELRASNTTIHGVYAEGPVSVHGSNIDFVDNVRPSVVSTGATGNVELRSSNVTLNGGVLTTGAFSHHGSNANFDCGIYASTIDLRGSNTTYNSCAQR